jgi:molybdopterin-containing oxidoreductase family membrane subunit
MDVQFKRIEGRSTGYYVAVCALAALAAAGAYCTWLMYVDGIYLTGMTNRIPWGLQIILAVFYIGLSAGSLVVSGLYGVFGKKEYSPFARLAAYLAMLFLIAGLLSILTDQGRIDRVMVMPFKFYNLSSMFSINPTLYSGHIILCVIYLWALFKNKHRVIKVSAVTVVIWAICVHSGTAAIFGFVPRELYLSPLLPPSFVAAALASGAAFMIVMLVGLFRATRRRLDDELIVWLGRLLAVFILVVIYFIVVENLHRAYVIEHQEAGHYFLFGGGHSILFWGGMMLVGFIIPAFILFSRRRGTNVRWVVFASTLVVIGILCERYLIVIPALTHAQAVFPGMEITSETVFEGVAPYTISIYEIVQALGVLGAVGFLFVVGLKKMYLLPTEARALPKQA